MIQSIYTKSFTGFKSRALAKITGGNVHTNNIKDPFAKLKKIIKLLATTVEDDIKTSHVNESALHQIIIAEGTKAYLTKHVSEHNKDHFLSPTKTFVQKSETLFLNVIPNTSTPNHCQVPLLKWHISRIFL